MHFAGQKSVGAGVRYRREAFLLRLLWKSELSASPRESPKLSAGTRGFPRVAETFRGHPGFSASVRREDRQL